MTNIELDRCGVSARHKYSVDKNRHHNRRDNQYHHESPSHCASGHSRLTLSGRQTGHQHYSDYNSADDDDDNSDHSLPLGSRVNLHTRSDIDAAPNNADVENGGHRSHDSRRRGPNSSAHGVRHLRHGYLKRFDDIVENLPEVNLSHPDSGI